MTFKAERVVTAGNDKFKVIGLLTLTRLERSVTMDVSAAYAGPVYGGPVVRTEMHEVTFLLKKEALDLSGAAHVNHEEFPELLSAIQDTNWPTVVKSEHCQMPSTIGGDYHGATCTGTVTGASTSSMVLIVPATSLADPSLVS